MSPGYRGRRVLVLGAGGFIGRWVARALSEAGADLRLAVREPVGFAAIARRYGIAGDRVAVELTRPGSLAELLEATRPDIVFNLAGYGVDPAERAAALLQRINVTLVEELIDGVSRQPAPGWQGLRLIHTGSALEYGDVGGDLDEAGPTYPTTPYGISKLAGTTLVMAAASLGALTARLFTVYGPGEHAGRLLPSLLEASRNGREVPLSAGTQQRDFTYVEDVADGLLRLGLLPEPTYPVVNLATGKLCQVKDFALRTARVLHIQPDRLGFGRLPGRSGEMHHAAVRTERLHELLGWRPGTDIEAGVAATAAFLGSSHDDPPP